ncbi:MAG: 5-deoxy-glucuronate isomerase [Anaerolineae bacterium]|nr:5-deoxy-glucuronate isomerase [Anaerolineae bacterium]
MRYNEETLLVRAKHADEDGHRLLNRVTAQEAGWALLNFEARRMAKGQTWARATGEHEAALVILGGQCSVRSDRGVWERIGRRPDVFSGMPYALYLPRRTAFEVTALTDGLEVAYGWTPTDQDHPPRLITPADSEIEIRGGRNATRQINSIIPPGFDCHRIVVCEVYTPGGNWSSYPPHKHDVHREGADGKVIEAELVETYYYKIDKPNGYAIQRVYTDDRAIDSAVVAHTDDIVLVPAGYHPVSAAYGYDCYYLNMLAGSAQSLANSDDPAHAWVKETWTALDPRLPMVTHGMEG